MEVRNMKKIATGTAGIAKDCSQAKKTANKTKVAKTTCTWGCCQNEY